MQRGGGSCNVAAAAPSLRILRCFRHVGSWRWGKADKAEGVNPSNDRFDTVNLYSFVNRVVHFVVTLTLMIMSCVD